MTAVVPTALPFADLPDLAGTPLGTSSWRTITQDMIDRFAALTGDEQWLHVDPVRAADGPFGGTIAHGFMTLSLATSIVTEVATFTGVSGAVNYGSDRVRFTAPVPSGSRLRAHVTLVSARRRGRQFTEVVLELAYELEDGTTPCTANLVFLLSPATDASVAYGGATSTGAAS